MKTDALFYELFRFDPQSLFELVQLDIEGRYDFESITLKTTEKRLDGFFKRIDGKGPNIFLEVQGYEDSVIYWRLFREICTWYEQTQSKEPFIAIILFINKKYDTGTCQLSCVKPNRLMQVYLEDCFKKIKINSGVLTVLKPLVLSGKKELPQHITQWKSDIYSLDLSEDQIKIITELLGYAILQRFPKLTLKEIQKMLELTPLDKTVAGQELIQMGLDKGIKKGMKTGIKTGMKTGELIGQILMAQRILKRPLTSKKDLWAQTDKQLKMILKQLEAEI